MTEELSQADLDAYAKWALVSDAARACPQCGGFVEPLRVTGHEQCPRCRYVWPCCSGEREL